MPSRRKGVALGLRKSDASLLLVTVFCVFFFGVFELRNWQAIRLSRQRAIDSAVAFHDAERLSSALENAKIARQAYLLTKDRTYLPRYLTTLSNLARTSNAFGYSSARISRRLDSFMHLAGAVTRSVADLEGVLARQAAPESASIPLTFDDIPSGRVDVQSRLASVKQAYFQASLDDLRASEEASRRSMIFAATGSLFVLTMLLAAAVRLNRHMLQASRLVQEVSSNRHQYQLLLERVNGVREDEQRRLSREIHDELGGALTGIKIDVTRLSRHLKSGQHERASEGLEGISAAVQDSLTSLRRIATGLRPAVLDHMGLLAAIEWQCDDWKARTGISVTLQMPYAEPTLGQDVTVALFRIFQECMTNVSRHARATEVYVTCEQSRRDFKLAIRDNGVGFRPGAVDVRNSLGLAGMRERARLIGAAFDIHSEGARGTTIAVSLPMSVPSREREDFSAAAHLACG